MNLAGRKVLLTGASGGIGQALSATLEAAGCEVLRHSLTRSFGDSIPSVRGDLRVDSNIEAIVLGARNFGVDTLINNSGINQLASFEASDIQRMIDINVAGPMKLTQALLPSLLEKPDAAIINVGSTFGEIGFPGHVSYCASKAAIKGFSEALRRELQDTNLQVFHVSPRATKTEMNSLASRQLNQALGNTEDDPDVLAEMIVDALMRNRFRLQIGFMEKLQVKLNGLFPGIVDLAIGNQLPVIKEHFSTQEIHI